MMVEFTKKITKFANKRLMIEIPKRYVLNKKLKKNDLVNIKKVEKENG